jgi:hypothetical protein
MDRSNRISILLYCSAGRFGLVVKAEHKWPRFEAGREILRLKKESRTTIVGRT